MLIGDKTFRILNASYALPYTGAEYNFGVLCSILVLLVPSILGRSLLGVDDAGIGVQ